MVISVFEETMKTSSILPRLLGRTAIVSVLMFVMACASGDSYEERPFDPDWCDGQTAYEIGYRDGNFWTRKTMNSTFARRCREDLKIIAQKKYQEGFVAGRAELDALVAAAREDHRANQVKASEPASTSAPVNQTNINVSIGGGNIGSGASQPTPPNPRAYFCTVKAFTDTFESYGATQLEATNAVRALCTKENHEMHCREIKCEKNI